MAALVLNLAASMFVDWRKEELGVPSPDSDHPTRVRFKNGRIMYFAPAVGGYYIASMWLHFIGLAGVIGFEAAARLRDRHAA